MNSGGGKKSESAYVKTDAGNDHAGGNLPPFALST
jgi:hypothetical protein